MSSFQNPTATYRPPQQAQPQIVLKQAPFTPPNQPQQQAPSTTVPSQTQQGQQQAPNQGNLSQATQQQMAASQAANQQRIYMAPTPAQVIMQQPNQPQAPNQGQGNQPGSAGSATNITANNRGVAPQPGPPTAQNAFQGYPYQGEILSVPHIRAPMYQMQIPAQPFQMYPGGQIFVPNQGHQAQYIDASNPYLAQYPYQYHIQYSNAPATQQWTPNQNPPFPMIRNQAPSDATQPVMIGQPQPGQFAPQPISYNTYNMSMPPPQPGQQAGQQGPTISAQAQQQQPQTQAAPIQPAQLGQSKRARQGVKIVDPNTKKEIDLEAAKNSATSTTTQAATSNDKPSTNTTTTTAASTSAKLTISNSTAPTVPQMQSNTGVPTVAASSTKANEENTSNKKPQTDLHVQVLNKLKENNQTLAVASTTSNETVPTPIDNNNNSNKQQENATVNNATNSLGENKKIENQPNQPISYSKIAQSQPKPLVQAPPSRQQAAPLQTQPQPQPQLQTQPPPQPQSQPQSQPHQANNVSAKSDPTKPNINARPSSDNNNNKTKQISDKPKLSDKSAEVTGVVSKTETETTPTSTSQPNVASTQPQSHPQAQSKKEPEKMVETLTEPMTNKTETIATKQEVVSEQAKPNVPIITVKATDNKAESEILREKSKELWTPENINGRKRYDREFLLSFKDKRLSRIIPDALRKNPDILVTEPKSHQQQHMNEPQFTRSRSNYGGMSEQGMMGSGSMGGYNKGSMSRGKKPSQYGPGKRDSMSTQTQQINIDKDLQLNKADNPYIIRRVLGEVSEQEDLMREVRNILNKLTPQNLEKLTKDLINLPINSEERLRGAIDIIFEKSIDEQFFSQTYAQLCQVLSHIKVPSEQGKPVAFRAMLLTRCQKEFETDYAQGINIEKMLKEVDECTDEVKKRELKELTDEKITKAKRRSLGNIRFIGELFKLKMLTEEIMNDCIERLLKQENDEENLECLCRLLTTIGKEVDKPSNVNKMKGYFEKLERIVKKKDTVCSRIRFMIMDVIDLRRNNWVPRHQDNNPRRIEEIRREHEEQQMRQEAERQQERRNQQQKGTGQKGSGGTGQGYSLKSTSMDSDSYNPRGGKQNVNMATKIKEVKNLTEKKDSENLVLGPSSSNMGFSWNKSRPQADSAQPSQAPSTLSSSSSFSASATKGSFTAHKTHIKQAEVAPRLSIDSNKGLKQIRNVKKIDTADSVSSLSRSGASSKASSRDTSLSRESIAIESNKKVRVTYTLEEIERKALNTIEEFIQHNDVNEALKDFDDLKQADPSKLAEFSEQLISKVLERSESARTLVGQLFYHAYKQQRVDVESLTEGFKRIFEVAEDMAIDVPKISTYLAQIIAPLFQTDISIDFLSNACEPIKESRICADLIAQTLHVASNAKVCSLQTLNLFDFSTF
jgi:translation initiation factor 4G